MYIGKVRCCSSKHFGLQLPDIQLVGKSTPIVGREINALFDIIDLPNALFGFAASSFNCGLVGKSTPFSIYPTSLRPCFNL